MFVGIGNTYYFNLKIGETQIGISPANLNSCNIITDMKRFLPYYQLSLRDEMGLLTHQMPTDSRFDKIKLSLDPQDYVDIQFRVKREAPVGESGNQAVYETEGLLDIRNLFSPSITRGFGTKSIGEIVQQIAIEIGCDGSEVGQSAFGLKAITYQPNWSNAKFLNYLKDKGGYYCFILFRKNRKILVFKNIDEMTIANNFKEYIYTEATDDPRLPTARNLKIYNNAGVLREEGIYQSNYSYYDYKSGKYVFANTDIDNMKMVSLSEYYAITPEDKGLSFVDNIGGSEQFNVAFKKQQQHKQKINDLIKVWVDIDGDVTMEPGKIIKLKFLFGVGTDLFSYQHSGYWLVERVIQSYGAIHITRLLLTRPGFSGVMRDTSFVVPKRVKRTD